MSSSDTKAISSSPDDSVIRILIMGRDGFGKSSSGNTILGEKRFEVQKRKKKHEAEIYDAVTHIGEKQVHVIDCPDVLDPDLNKEKLEMMKEQLVSGCSAGLSSVLLTVPLEKPVGNEEEILDFFKCLFGREVQKYIMILFTHGDELEDLDETIDEHLKHHADLQRLLTECGGKFHCFNNKSKSDSQIQGLLQKIEGMMMENGGKFIMKQMRRNDSMDNIFNFSGKSPAEDSDVINMIPERKDQIRLVLLGKTGSGKSAAGNTIIGRNVFESSISSNSQTKQCQSETIERISKQISVIDTPGLYHTKLNEKEVKTEIVKCITYASPGPHAFIIVIKVGTFANEEKNTIKELKEVFGEQMEKYSMILFTHKDQLEKQNKTIEEFLENNSDLKELVESCGNRFFCLDNKSASFTQFRDLISKTDKMVKENGGYFTNEMFYETEKYIQEIQKQKLDEKVKQFKQKHKMVDQTEWQKIYCRLIEESRREVLYGDNAHICIAVHQFLIVAIPEEKESAVKEAESKRISRRKAVRLAFRTTGKLAKQKMCGIQ